MNAFWTEQVLMDSFYFLTVLKTRSCYSISSYFHVAIVVMWYFHVSDLPFVWLCWFIVAQKNASSQFIVVLIWTFNQLILLCRFVALMWYVTQRNCHLFDVHMSCLKEVLCKLQLICASFGVNSWNCSWSVHGVFGDSEIWGSLKVMNSLWSVPVCYNASLVVKCYTI